MKTPACLSDPELFCLLKEGQPSAFDIIYKRYYPQLYRAAWQQLGCHEYAEEMAQEVLVQLYQKRTAIGSTEHLSGYLFTLLRNRMVDLYRQQKRKQNLDLKLRQKQSIVTPPAELALESKQLAQDIEQTISRLPEKCRVVFRLSREQNLSNQEIADKMNLSVSTVEKHIAKALKKLREVVELRS
ncbi:RNA polymerase sigma-70 factor, ECF subfamily [Cnuella takakiae]|uniref:RNA polymerase sigma-70 factor, ECF subfamily n=1 Tax=Cnuella takakiae TaxID=1302690 RepID=A0A1M5DXY8_9BACT|nr:hypothetical protein BUE76_19585 [Cnuella takakiae]SHF71776.1 RNA polymerase sigma-70 factor, ECF subfamily [Cnuella takakiae]